MKNKQKGCVVSAAHASRVGVGCQAAAMVDTVVMVLARPGCPVSLLFAAILLAAIFLLFLGRGLTVGVGGDGGGGGGVKRGRALSATPLGKGLCPCVFVSPSKFVPLRACVCPCECANVRGCAFFCACVLQPWPVR